MEKFFATVYSKKLLSVPGRITIIVIWAILTTIAMYGMLKVRTDFSMELFIPVDSSTEHYYLMDMKYFKTGFDTDIILENPNMDYTSEEVQF